MGRLMRITRPWPYRGRVFQVGQVGEFPDATCERMAASNPPFGVPLEEDQPAEPDKGGYSMHLFTEAALKVLGEYKLDFDDFEGDASGVGGRVTKADVLSWLATIED